MKSDLFSIEVEVACPHCGETFATFVDPSEDHQSYVEDCYICCRPIQFNVTCEGGDISMVETTKE